jgi:hypothetical protein
MIFLFQQVLGKIVLKCEQLILDKDKIGLSDENTELLSIYRFVCSKVRNKVGDKEFLFHNKFIKLL